MGRGDPLFPSVPNAVRPIGPDRAPPGAPDIRPTGRAARASSPGEEAGSLQHQEPMTFEELEAAGLTPRAPSRRRATPRPRRSRRRRFPTCSPGATCSAARRPAPARRRRSRCRSSSACAPRRPRAAARPVRCLVLTPDARARRRRSARASRPTARHLPLRHTVIFGGVGQDPQVQRAAPRRRHPRRHAGPPARPDAAAAGVVSRALEIFVLDEADRMLDMGFIHDVQRDHRGAAAQAADAVLLGDMPPGHHGARAQHPARPGARRGHAGRDHRRDGRPVGLLRREARASARCSTHLLDDADADAARSSSRAPSTAPTASPSTCEPARHPRRRHPRQQVAERPRARARRASRPARSACSSRPTSPRAASTSTASRTSSTSTCPTCPRATCTASAAPAAPAPAGIAHLVLRRRGARVPARHRAHHPPERARRRGPSVPLRASPASRGP